LPKDQTVRKKLSDQESKGQLSGKGSQEGVRVNLRAAKNNNKKIYHATMNVRKKFYLVFLSHWSGNKKG